MHSPYENTNFLINKKDEEALKKLLQPVKTNFIDKVKKLIRNTRRITCLY